MSYRRKATLACQADSFRYGQWEHVPAGGLNGECGDWRFANLSCLAPLSVEKLCRGLQYKPVLIVGDSLMLAAFTTLL